MVKLWISKPGRPDPILSMGAKVKMIICRVVSLVWQAP